ncbi:MAG: glycosyltransferase family 1 protein, partial [Sphingobacteriaceae bacterium]
KKPGSDGFLGIINPDLIQEINNWQADAILVYGWAYQAHLKAIRYFKNKIPVYFRGDSTLLNRKKGIKNSITTILLRWVYGYIDHAFYVGTSNKAYFKQYGLQANQLTFAPHAIDNERFNFSSIKEALALRAQFKIADHQLLILFSGKLIPRKNPLLLLEAFSKLQKSDVHLLFAGNGILEDTLKTRTQELKLTEKVHFLNFQNQTQMPALYQACDLFCLPSEIETWGLAVNEAMACSKAILVSNLVGCAVDLVKPSVNGEIFESGNEQSLLEKLQVLTQSQSRLKEYGTASGSIIRDWSFNQMVENITQQVLKS